MTWVQVDAFKRELRAYQDRTGKTQAQVAEDLGTTYGTLRFWLSGTRPPKRKNLEAASKLFGCSILEFQDDPGGDPDQAEDASEMDRFMSRAMGSDLAKLTPEQKQAAFEVWRATIRGFLGK